MDTEKLLVHNGSQRKGAERLHARIVDALGVLALACVRGSLINSALTGI